MQKLRICGKIQVREEKTGQKAGIKTEEAAGIKKKAAIE
jgi:hypothetical protein